MQEHSLGEYKAYNTRRRYVPNIECWTNDRQHEPLLFIYSAVGRVRCARHVMKIQHFSEGARSWCTGSD